MRMEEVSPCGWKSRLLSGLDMSSPRLPDLAPREPVEVGSLRMPSPPIIIFVTISRDASHRPEGLPSLHSPYRGDDLVLAYVAQVFDDVAP